MTGKDDRVIDITDNVKWIGILDYDIRTFDIVMTTDYGTTYNSYFINAEKKALVEVAKGKFFDTYLKKLKEVTDPSEISYIILEHIPFRSMIVKDGDTLDLGNKKLKFISAPNLHWPDSIYTWLEEDRILFTCDSFGAHYCSYEMKDDLNEDYLKAFTYYFDVILKPFSRFMVKAIERIKPLDASYICPGHGPILGKNRNKIVELTMKYASDYLDLTLVKARRHILIVYVSAYGYTKRGAEIIAEGINEASDFSIDMVDIEHTSLDDLDARLTVSDAILVGSPTINQNTLLQIYRLFAIINPLRDKGKLAGAFGSYGWSGEAPKIIVDTMRNLKLKIFGEPAGFKFLPGGTKEENLRDYGRRFAIQFEEECAQK
jgi:flavorubredoxin